VAALAELAADRLEPDFDLEAGWNLLTGLAATARENLDLAEAPTWVRRWPALHGLAHRGRAADPTVAAVPAWAEALQAAQAELSDTTEQALRHSAAGDPQTAVATLLAQAERTSAPACWTPPAA
jgi:hypothetical protein